jgi:hypothetical protein
MSDFTSYPCECGAILRVSANAACDVPETDFSTDLRMAVDMRITRAFTHEGSGMTDTCREYVLALRRRLAAADLQSFREYAGLVEMSV